MPIPVWTPGQVLLASDVNSWLVPAAAVKTADQSVTSSTTLVNDTALVLPVAASATYMFWCFLDYEGGTQGSSDIKWGWTVPAAATMRYTAANFTTAGAASVGNAWTEANVPTAGSNGAAAIRGIALMGTIVVSTTAGSMQLQWAQNTSSGTATIVHAQSVLFAQRLS